MNHAKYAIEGDNLDDKLMQNKEELSAECEVKHFEKIDVQLPQISNKDGATKCTGV